MKKLRPEFWGAAAAAAAAFMPGHARAQSVPYTPITLGEVWTPAQWQAAWASKQDLSAIPGGGGYVSVKSFGAVGDGVADDTNAIKNGEASLQPGQVLWFPPGTYRFTSALGPFTRQGFCWKGEGYNQSILLYNGAATNIDLLTIGNGAAVVSGVFMDGLSIRSNTTMTAGSAINAQATARAIYNVNLQGTNGVILYGNKLWNGLAVSQGDQVVYGGEGISALNNGIQVWGGSLGQTSFYTLPGLFISGCAVGIYIAGGFSDIAIAQSRITNCTNAIKVDQSIAAAAVNEMFLTGVYIEASLGNGIELAEPSGALMLLITGCNISWGHTNGIHFAAPHKGFTVVSGCEISNHTLDGINIDPAAAVLCSVFGNVIMYNQGWGINCAAGASVPTAANYYTVNTLGNISNQSSVPADLGTLSSGGFINGTNGVGIGGLGSHYYLGMSGANNPLINFDTNDYIQYDRTNNIFSFDIAGQNYVNIQPNQVFFNLTGFYIDWNNTTTPLISFDSGDTYYYDRGANMYGWVIGGNTYMTLNNSWLAFPQISAFGINIAPGSNPYIQWDVNDYYQYDRTNNMHLFAVGSGVQLQIGGGFIRQGAMAVASLPSASAVQSGARAMVSNATATTFYSIVAGGGTNVVPVFSDGTNWRIG